MRLVYAIATSVLPAFTATANAQQSSTLEKTKRNGYVSCGASEGVPASPLPDQSGVWWTGFDIDWCRA